MAFPSPWSRNGHSNTMTGEQRQMLRDAAVYLTLSLAVVLVFGRSLDFEFVNYDDPHYVINNYNLHKGLTLESIQWAFTTGYAENWHPLTWLSHMLDFQLYGMNPATHRLTNILLHLASTLTLLIVLRRMTGAYWQSAVVAALFAVHPLHVESVVWVAERKDALSALFWMLTLAAYAQWYAKPSRRNYALLVLVFALGLLAKSMLVTLPFVLLLLDIWPYRRWSPSRAPWSSAFKLIKEKTPLFALAFLFSLITYLVQVAGGTTKSFEVLPLATRLANMPVAYATYIGKMLYPTNLAILYPHPGAGLPLWQVLAALALLALITYAAYRTFRRAPYVMVGWLWFLGTLVPVIGLIQVGDQAVADRYTYIPLVGLFITIAWGIPDLLGALPHPPRIARTLALPTAAILIAVAVAAWIQVGYWRDSITLFQRCLAVTQNNAPAHNNLGMAYYEKNRLEEAVTEYEKALAILPGLFMTHNNLGLILLEQGKYEEAAAQFEQTLTLEPDDRRPHLNLGIALALQGKLELAEASFRKALELRPNYLPTRYNLGALLVQRGQFEEARTHLTAVIDIQSTHLDAREKLGQALMGLDLPLEAAAQFSEIIRLQPQSPTARHHLDQALEGLLNRAQTPN